MGATNLGPERASDASGRERRERNASPAARTAARILALCALLASSHGLGQDESGLFAGLRRTTLESGLQVWSLPRPQTQTVALRLRVQVGFRDESAEDYGLAHFTEHWMFTPTAARSEDEVKAFISDLGGRWNGITHLDWTVFQCELLAGDLELGLQWLAEILGACRFEAGLEDRVRREVREEYRNTYAVLPAGLDRVRRLTGWGTSADRASALMFPDSSVVLRSTRLGPALDRLSVEQARGLWQTHYVASNMALVAVGRLDPLKVEELARRGFASIRPGPRPAFPLRRTPDRAGRRLEVHESLPCLLSERAIGLGLRTDGRRSAGRPAEMLALRVLRDRLEQDLVYERSVLEDVGFLRLEGADAGLVVLYSLHDAGRHGQVRQSLERHVAELAARGPSEAALEQARAEVLGALLRGGEQNADLAQELAEMSSAFGPDEPLPDLLALVTHADPGSVRRASARLLAAENQLWLVWRPSFSLLYAGLAAAGLVAMILLIGRWRRRTRRGRGRRSATLALIFLGLASARAEGLHIERGGLPGGPEIWLCRAPHTRTAAVELVIRAGSRDETPEHAGAVALLREVLLAGGRAGDETATKTRLERLGGRWWCWGNKEVTHLGAHVPAERLGDALRWLADVAGGPAFQGPKVEAHRALALQRLRRDALFDLLWFGGRLDRQIDQALYAGCGLAWDGRGSRATLQAVNGEVLRRLHSERFGRGQMTLVLVGPIGLEDAIALASKELAGLPEGLGRRARQRCPMPESAPEPLLVVSRAPRLTGRSPVRVGYPTLGAADPDLWPLTVARTMLSKSAFEALRNRLGLVYGARAELESASDRGLLFLEAEAEPSSRQVLISAMEGMFRSLAERAEGSEVDRARRRLRGSLLRRRDSILGLLHTLGGLAALEPPGRPAPDPVRAIDAVAPEEVQSAMQRLIARRRCIAYAEPVLTGQGVLTALAFVALGLVLAWLWRRRRRRRRILDSGLA
jgi:predicted Zn-dependent peptidase